MPMTRLLLTVIVATLSSLAAASAQPATPEPGMTPCAGPHRDPAAIVAAINPSSTPVATPVEPHDHAAPGAATPSPVEPVGTPRLLRPRLSIGTPASSAVVVGLTEAMQRYLACANAGDVIGLMSLVSDDFLRQSFGGSILTEAELRAYAAAGRPLPVERRRRLVAVREARRLADGRVAALVDSAPVTSESPAAVVTDLVTFTQVDGRWLVDQYLAGVTAWFGPDATPSPSPT